MNNTYSWLIITIIDRIRTAIINEELINEELINEALINENL